MGIQNISEKVIFVDLPSDTHQMEKELNTLNETVINNSNCDVVIDFFGVELITSANISNLLILRKLLEEHERRLILCSVAVMTKYIFTVSGLDSTFEFADDRSAALSALQCTEQPS